MPKVNFASHTTVSYVVKNRHLETDETLYNPYT